MQVSKTVLVEIARSPEEVFDFVTAVETPARVFSGFGPIPGVNRTQVVGGGPIEPGAVCRTQNSDGSSTLRTITVMNRPSRHEYLVDAAEFRPLFRAMVRGGIGVWQFEEAGNRTRLYWTYRFELRRPIWWLPVALIIAAFFGPAMRRCLLQTRRLLELSTT